jgi:large subunit ribosomal protein L21
MKYAIITLGGKQVKIQEGDTFQIPGNSILDTAVLCYSDGEKTLIGTPELKDIVLDLEVVDVVNGNKVQVKRFKAKSRYKKNKGHKQPVSLVKVNGFGHKGDTKKVEASIDHTEKAEEKTEEVKPLKKVKAEKTEAKPIKKASSSKVK